MSGGLWKVVETGAGEVGMEEIKERRSEGRGRAKERREGEKEETEKGGNSRSQKSSGRMGNMG